MSMSDAKTRDDRVVGELDQGAENDRRIGPVKRFMGEKKPQLL